MATKLAQPTLYLEKVTDRGTALYKVDPAAYGTSVISNVYINKRALERTGLKQFPDTIAQIEVTFKD